MTADFLPSLWAMDAALVAKGYNRATTVVGDQRESLMLASAFAREHFRFKALDWTATSKPAAVARVRRWLADGVLAIDPHEAMLKEMLRFEERVTSSGAFTFGARGSGHDDYVALLITAAMADAGGPMRPRATTSGRILTGSIDTVTIDTPPATFIRAPQRPRFQVPAPCTNVRPTQAGLLFDPAPAPPPSFEGNWF